MNADATLPVKPALARVTIYEVTVRSGYELITSAQVDDHIYVGSRAWREQQLNNPYGRRVSPPQD
jgi:hypothetical protein